MTGKGHGAAPADACERLHADDAPALRIGPGCVRRDFPGVAGVRVWIVEMAPGSRWPQVDHHDAGEAYYVLEGEVIEGDTRIGAGSYVRFAPGSAHQPHTETGVRLFGLNPPAA